MSSRRPKKLRKTLYCRRILAFRQRASLEPPRELQEPLRRRQKGPRGRPGAAKGGPREAQEPPRAAKSGPGGRPGLPGELRRRPGTGPGAAQGLQGPSRGPKSAPGALPEAPRGPPKEASKRPPQHAEGTAAKQRCYPRRFHKLTKGLFGPTKAAATSPVANLLRAFNARVHSSYYYIYSLLWRKW